MKERNIEKRVKERDKEKIKKEQDQEKNEGKRQRKENEKKRQRKYCKKEKRVNKKEREGEKKKMTWHVYEKNEHASGWEVIHSVLDVTQRKVRTNIITKYLLINLLMDQYSLSVHNRS